MAGHDFAGHTEILAHLCGVESVTMMLAAGDFRVSHVSTHVSLRQAVERVTVGRITRVIGLTINHENMDEAQVDAAIGQYERELGVLATDALTRSPASLVDMVLAAFPELAGISSAATR